MFRCSSMDVLYPDGKAECSGNFVDYDSGVLRPRGWITPTHNFDTSYFAFL